MISVFVLLTMFHSLYLIGPWISACFSVDGSNRIVSLRFWNVQVLSSTMVQVQCLHCMVLEIQLLFPISSTKCDASNKHDA